MTTATRATTPPVDPPDDTLTSEERALVNAVRSRLPLTLRHRVESLLDGDHESVHVGRSLDFNDLRSYVPGDDVKDVDWKATARRGELLVRRHVAQRRAVLMVGVCGTPGMSGWCDVDVPKARLAAVVTAIMAQVAVDHGDRVAMVRSAPWGTTTWRPTARPARVEIMLHDVLALADDLREHPGSTADPHVLETVLSTATAALRRPGVLLLIRDDEDLTSAEADALSRASVRHDVIVVTLRDMLATDPLLAGRRIVAAGGGRSVMHEVLGDARLAEAAEADRLDRARRVDSLMDDLGIVHARVGSIHEAPETLALALARRGGRP